MLKLIVVTVFLLFLTGCTQEKSLEVAPDAQQKNAKEALKNL